MAGRFKNTAKTGGRKKGSLNKTRDEARELIDKVLRSKNFGGTKFIFEKLAELGNGVECAEVKDGETRVYSKEPNALALKTLAEYRFGKPAQILDVNAKVEQIGINLD
jgi:hypothetical protein